MVIESLFQQLPKTLSIVLFASGIVSVTFRFWPVLPFSGSLLMMLFTFFDSHKYPIVFFINASAKQIFNRQDYHPPYEFVNYTSAFHKYLCSDSCGTCTQIGSGLVAGPVGFEPTVFGSEGRRLNPC